MALKENYKDDILDTSQNVKRKYQMENNGDGTVSFTDVTEYTQQGDSFGSGDINATNSKVNTIDSAVTTLNANLDGFKFYPTGTGIVGLIADDSAYTDEDGNYVVWGTATANQLVEDNPNTYKSVASTEDLRGEVGADTAIPFSKVEDINPNKTIDWSYGAIRFNSADGYSINVANYKKVWLCFLQAVSGSSSFKKIAFYDNNKQQVGSSFLLNLVAQTWSDAIEIPKGAIYLVLLTTNNMSSNYVTWSLKA